jgi:GNAT superfamily N-acetyltransferase
MPGEGLIIKIPNRTLTHQGVLVKVLRGNESHIDQIMEVWKEFMEYHQSIDPYYGTVKDGHLKFGEYIIERMAREDSLVLVGMDKEDLLGYCLSFIHLRPPVFTEKSVGIISDLAVRRSHKKEGVGGALVESSLEWFRDRGVTRVELRTSALNYPSIVFYQEHGFRIYDHMMTREV